MAYNKSLCYNMHALMGMLVDSCVGGQGRDVRLCGLPSGKPSVPSRSIPYPFSPQRLTVSRSDSRGPASGSGRSSRGSRSTAFNYESVQSTRLSAREELRRSESREGGSGTSSTDALGRHGGSSVSYHYRGTGLWYSA